MGFLLGLWQKTDKQSALMIVLAGLLVMTQCQLMRQKDANDVLVANVKTLGDSMVAFTLRSDASQQAAARTQLQDHIVIAQLSSGLRETTDRLRLVQRAVTQVGIVLDSVKGSRTGGVFVGNERLLSDTLTKPPILGIIAARAPRDTLEPMQLTHDLTVAPIQLEVALGCTKAKPVQPTVQTVGPTWANVTVGMGQVEPSVCNPPTRPFLGLESKAGFIVGLGAGAGLAWLILR